MPQSTAKNIPASRGEAPILPCSFSPSPDHAKGPVEDAFPVPGNGKTLSGTSMLHVTEVRHCSATPPTSCGDFRQDCLYDLSAQGASIETEEGALWLSSLTLPAARVWASNTSVVPTSLRKIDISPQHQPSLRSIPVWSHPTDNLSPCNHLSTNPPFSHPSVRSQYHARDELGGSICQPLLFPSYWHHRL